MQRADVIVVGEGIAGLTAARLLADAGKKVTTIEAHLFGGSILNVNALDPCVDDAPSSGSELAAELAERNLALGVVSVSAPVTAVAAVAGGGFSVKAGEISFEASGVVCASGGSLKRLNVPGEAALIGRGVSQCADCDGPMFRGKDVVVVGGGDSAFQEALILAEICRSVVLLHRGQTFRASPRFVQRAESNSKLTILRNAIVRAIRGSRLVEAVQVEIDGRTTELKCDGVFPYIGARPNSQFLPADVSRDPEDFVLTDARYETSMARLWAIGAVRSGFKGTAADAVDEATSVATAILARLSTSREIHQR